jgi:serine/threonine kinase 3
MVMEYCAGGSVSDIIKTCKITLSEEQIAVVCRSALRGLRYLHERFKIHRDIKAGNILLTSGGEGKLGTTHRDTRTVVHIHACMHIYIHT